MEIFGELHHQPKSVRRGLKVGVVPNTDKDNDLTYTRAVCAFLEAQGATPMLSHAVAEAAGCPARGVDAAGLYRDADFIAVLGGDGTMLRAAHTAALYDTPMIGINLGTLGYLTDADRHDGLDALAKVLDGAGRMEKRLMLTIGGPALEGLFPEPGETLALNDICLSRGGFGKLITLKLYVNGLYMDTLRADGVMVATPTGSTAYNLSAGGPILTPDGSMMVVTAVCPHDLYTRPWVLSAEDVVDIDPADAHGATISIDGEIRLTLCRGQRVRIRRADCDATIIKTSNRSFYEILRRKIGHDAPFPRER